MMIVSLTLTFFLLKAALSTATTRSTVIEMRIPWPSGIQVDKVQDASGGEHRFGRLQQNSVSLRPEWQAVNLVENVFSVDECKAIINQAEKHAKSFGWSKGRHIDYDIRPTKDLPVDIIYENEKELLTIYDRFETRVYPRIAKEYSINASLLHVTDLFITKYNASTRERLLGPHKDKSPWSFVIPLNGDFEGGGSYFFDTQELWKPPVGGAVYFSGNQLHGGSPVTSGVRYILAGFCDYGAEEQQEALFAELYDPLYDGYAAQAGFKTGDLIVGLEVCEEEVAAEEEVAVDAVGGVTTANGGELKSVKDVDSDTTTPATTTSDGDSVAASSSSSPEIVKKVRRRMVDVVPSMTDAEWIPYAQSCERRDPGSDTVMRVRRRL